MAQALGHVERFLYVAEQVRTLRLDRQRPVDVPIEARIIMPISEGPVIRTETHEIAKSLGRQRSPAMRKSRKVQFLANRPISLQVGVCLQSHPTPIALE